MKLCPVCKEEATRLITGVLLCDPCRRFFQKNIKKAHRCESGTRKCNLIGTDNRSCCSYCRIQKCLKAGVSKKKYLEEEKKREMKRSTEPKEISQPGNPKNSKPGKPEEPGKKQTRTGNPISHPVKIEVKSEVGAHTSKSARLLYQPKGTKKNGPQYRMRPIKLEPNETTIAQKSDPRKMKVDKDDQCPICSDFAERNSHNVRTCGACVRFFVDNKIKAPSFTCKENEQCPITLDNRNICCKFCRYQKCLTSGMQYKSSDNQKMEKEPKNNKIKREAVTKQRETDESENHEPEKKRIKISNPEPSAMEIDDQPEVSGIDSRSAELPVKPVENMKVEDQPEVPNHDSRSAELPLRPVETTEIDYQPEVSGIDSRSAELPVKPVENMEVEDQPEIPHPDLKNAKLPLRPVATMEIDDQPEVSDNDSRSAEIPLKPVENMEVDDQPEVPNPDSKKAKPPLRPVETENVVVEDRRIKFKSSEKQTNQVVQKLDSKKKVKKIFELYEKTCPYIKQKIENIHPRAFQWSYNPLQCPETKRVAAWKSHSVLIHQEMDRLLKFVPTLQTTLPQEYLKNAFWRNAFSLLTAWWAQGITNNGLLFEDGQSIRRETFDLLYGTKLALEIITIACDFRRLKFTDHDMAMFIAFLYLQPLEENDASSTVSVEENNELRRIFNEYGSGGTTEKLRFQEVLELIPKMNTINQSYKESVGKFLVNHHNSFPIGTLFYDMFIAAPVP